MRRIVLLSALVLALGSSGTAQALQFVPTATSRLHTLGSGAPGAEWTTEIDGAGQLSYDAGTGVATLTAVLDVLNYYDPGNGACPSDAPPPCSHNYTQDLLVTLDAQFVGVVTNVISPTQLVVTLNFETTANALPDLSVVDPSDNGTVLLGNWTSGLYNGNATTGLSMTVLFNPIAGTTTFDELNSNGFLVIDPSSAYASLFESGMNYFGVNIGTLSNFSIPGGLAAVIAAAASSGTLPSFTAEANGQVFRLESNDFVIPEPATAVLLAGGLALLGARRRSH